MNYKKSIAMLSLVAVPAAITTMPTESVQAAPQDQLSVSESWINPYFSEGHKIVEKVATVHAVATTTPIVVHSTEELKQAIYTNIRQFNTEFSIKYVGDTRNLGTIISQIYKDLLTDETMIYESGTIAGSQINRVYSATEADIRIVQGYHTTAAQEQIVTQRVQEITQQIISSSMSDLEIIKAVNDYVVVNTAYSTNTNTSPHAAYTILNEGKGVCQAYALLAYRLLKEAGIEAKYVTGHVADGLHAWNLVKLNNQWYHMDTTWNDPVFSMSAGDMSDFVSYEYFLLSDEDIEKGHRIDNNGYPSATDNTYRPLHSVQTPVQVGSVLYYPNAADNSQLYKIDLENIAAGATKVSSTRVKNLVAVKDWLYFSNYSNGKYLSKMKLDGTEQVIVKHVAITSLKLDGNDLVYNKTERIQVIDPDEENKAAAKIVSELIAVIDEAAPNFIELVANARVAYDALTATQQGFVVDVERLEQAEEKIKLENAAVNAVIQKIAQLQELEEQFHTKVSETRAAYESLDRSLQQRITNKTVLETAEAKVEDNKVKAAGVAALIHALDTTNAAYYAATTAARDAYDLLIAPQRNLITATTLQQLEVAEQQKAVDEEAVFAVNYQLELLTDNAANFKTIVLDLRTKYDGLTANQQTLVTKLAVLEAAEDTHKHYAQEAVTMEAAIAALDENKEAFYVDVQTLDGQYNRLNPAQLGFISSAAKESLQEMLELASTNLNAAQTVRDQIAAVSVANTNFAQQLSEAKAAYAQLTTVQKNLVTNYNDLMDVQAVLLAIQQTVTKISAIPDETAINLVAAYTEANHAYNALSIDAQKHVNNANKLQATGALIAAANAVQQQIAALTIAAVAADVEAARASYTALGSLAKELVTNITDLLEAELRLKQEADQIQANTVAMQITALQPVDIGFIAKYESAVAAYAALTDDQKAYVTNYAALISAAADVEKIQQVMAAIAGVSEVATYKAEAAAAQAQYDDLDVALQVAVTNAAMLTVFTTNITAAEQVEQEITALTASSSLDAINQVKADYAALTALQQQLVLNVAQIIGIENKVKAHAAEAFIADLEELDEESFIIDVTKARMAYDALTAEQKDLVTNVAKLEAAEMRVADIIRSNEEIATVIQLIAKIDAAAANFVSAVEQAEQAYAVLAPEQQSKVTNEAHMASYKETIARYEATAEQFESQVTSLDTASVTFIEDVEEINNQYVLLNAAQVTFIDLAAKARLEGYLADIVIIREVEAQLLLLDALSTNYYTQVAAAKAAYEALRLDYQQLIAAQAVVKLEDAIEQVAVDEAVAQRVQTAIDALTKDSAEAAVQTARAQYNALTANQQQLVKNETKLVEVEKALANAGSSTPDGNTSGEGSSTPGGNTSGGGSSSSGGSSSGGGSSSSGGSSSGGGSSSSGGSSSGGSSSSIGGSGTPSASTTNNEALAQPTVQVGENGTSYSTTLPLATVNAQPVTITMSENVRITVPQAAIPTAANTASIAMTVHASEANVIQFKATMDDAPVKFATYIEFEVANLPDGAVVLRRDANGNLSAVPFTVVDGKHVIKTRTSGEFIVSTVNVTFNDVAKDGHKAYIDELAKRHIVTGVDAESFDPNAGMTRAQFSAMIARAMNLEPEGETSFTDVKGKWYEGSVQALVEAGIVKGKSAELFDPGQTITRQQTSVMVERLLNYAGVDLPQPDLANVPFTDFDKVPASYKSSVALMYELGIFTGKADGSFDASGELTRSQMTKVLYKALQLAGML